VCARNKVPSKIPTYTYNPGDKFSYLTLVKLSRKTDKAIYWVCRCDCGVEKEYQIGQVRAGFTKSCGCKRTELLREAATTHGKSRTDEYGIWGGMIDRCYNPDGVNYPYWGARGITVCDRWRDSFEAFLEDMGPRPSKRHQIDRVDNDGNYEPGNCRWATVQQQALNRRTSKLKNIVIEAGDASDDELKNWQQSPRLLAIFKMLFEHFLPVDLTFSERLGKTGAIFTCSKIN